MQMITADDWNHGAQMNLKEARLMNGGVMKGRVEHKYDYATPITRKKRNAAQSADKLFWLTSNFPSPN